MVNRVNYLAPDAVRRLVMTCRTLDTKVNIYLDARCPNFSLVHVTTALQPIAGSARRVRVALFESYSRGCGSYEVVRYAGGELVSRQVCSSEIRWFSLFFGGCLIFQYLVYCLEAVAIAQ